MKKLLTFYEKDNSTVYFESVPQKLPADKKLAEGLVMGKMEEYKLEEVEPVLLILPDEGSSAPPARTLERSDSDIARELQQKLNQGLEL